MSVELDIEDSELSEWQLFMAGKPRGSKSEQTGARQ
jgi:hypothetical protein